jgi:transglutaminase-like putative cysteine protease
MYWVRHITAYAYDQPVDLAAHLLHLKPRALPGQRVIHARIRCQPAPDHATETHDHFGNAATRIFIAAPHQHFEVTAEALVAVDFAPPPPPEATLPWDVVADQAQRGCDEATEYLHASAHAPALALALSLSLDCILVNHSIWLSGFGQTICFLHGARRVLYAPNRGHACIRL